MYHAFNFGDVLASSVKAAWQVEDVLPAGAELDFSRRFMRKPSPAPTGSTLSDDESESSTYPRPRISDDLRLVEDSPPFVLDHARPQLNGDDHRVRALLNFAGEEAKHIHLFRLFHRRFTEAFGTPCEAIGPAEAIAAEVLSHDPLSVALVILQVEWMTQSHYVDSVRDDQALDPLFKSLLKHHWMEEAQHAKLDTLMVEALADGRDEAGIQAAIDGYLEIGAFLDCGFAAQTALNLDSFEKATGRKLGDQRREHLQAQQHQALRWTYLGSGMVHPKFTATLAGLSPAARDRIAAVAPAFA